MFLIALAKSQVFPFAFDNYDENCKILSGAGTVHDTVGICSQNLLYVTIGDTEKPSLLDGKRRRSGSLRYQDSYLKLYRKRPIIDWFSFKVKEVHRPRELSQLEDREIIWITSKTYMKTHMWSGWNSFTTQGFLHLGLSPIQGSSANLHLVSLSKELHCHLYRNMWCLRQ